MATRKRATPAKNAKKPRATKTSAPPKDLLSIASKNFGYQSFRPGQEEVIRALLAKQDCLVVMPTGSGKSAIYQVAGLAVEGVTLVISPLIALQKDQMDTINESDAPEAVAINSSQRVSEARAAISKIEEGKSKYIFLAPEQLRRHETIEMLDKAKVSLFVVDEAHCISEWGHDFRPDYMQLGPTIERLGHPPVLAMTATASVAVREEIAQRLGLRDAKIFVHGFDRPNISLRVDHFETEDQKLQELVHRVNWAEKPGIVYVATRKHAETIMHALAEDQVKATFYHAGLKASERRQIQDQFMSGEAEVIVATNAFGMGIDKANVRFVYHFDISDAIDSYYQEIGRGGRDGQPAEAVLFYRTQDIGVQRFLSGEGKLATQEFEKVADVIADQEGPVEPEEISDELDLSKRKLTSVIQRLEDAGAVEILPTGEVEAAENVDTAAAAQRAAEEQERRKEAKAERLRQMQEYAETSECRRVYLLRYFGENYPGPCCNCDNCAGNTVSEEASDIAVDPSVGTRREVA